MRLKAPDTLDQHIANAHRIRAASASNDDSNTAKWRRGDLRHLHLPHILPFVDAFEAWNARRQTDEYLEMCEAFEDAGSQTFDDVWMDYFARRVGKTGKWVIQLTEIALRRPGAILTYFTAKYKEIGEIVVPLARMIVMGASVPADCRCEYKKSKGEHGEGLFFPNGSIVKLVGVDTNPDGLRGRFSDGMVGSEVAFMKAIEGIGIEDTIRSVLLPQFQHRPWAFLALETSAPRDPDHPVLTLFKPDCARRGALQEGTIDCNTGLSERDKRKYIRQAGGRGHPTCEREYYNVTTREKERFLVPEFDRDLHVRKVPRPDFALAYCAADPGSRDLFALTWGYYDFVRAQLVVQRSWAARNPSHRQVAAVCAYYEWVLWGRPPHQLMREIPLQRHRGRDGWVELLVGTPATLDDCAELRELANAEQPHTLAWMAKRQPADRFSYWDGSVVQQNPYARVSDVDLPMIRNLSSEYGIGFAATEKDHADAQRGALRDAIGSGRVVFDPEAGPVIDHVEHAIWNEHRTDWARHPIYGHYDCLAALIYLWRNVNRDKNPAIPELQLVERVDEYLPMHVKQEAERAARELEEAFFGAGKGRKVTRLVRKRR